MDATDTSAKRAAVREYPDDVKELAFELWLFKAGKSARVVSELLATEDYGSLDVHPRTIKRWSIERRWSAEVASRYRAIFPAMHQEVGDNLAIAALQLSEYAVRASAGSVRVDRDMNALAKIVLDAAGHAPLKPEPDIARIRPALPILTDEQRRVLAARVAGNDDD